MDLLLQISGGCPLRGLGDVEQSLHHGPREPPFRAREDPHRGSDPRQGRPGPLSARRLAGVLARLEHRADGCRERRLRGRLLRADRDPRARHAVLVPGVERHAPAARPGPGGLRALDLARLEAPGRSRPPQAGLRRHSAGYLAGGGPGLGACAAPGTLSTAGTLRIHTGRPSRGLCSSGRTPGSPAPATLDGRTPKRARKAFEKWAVLLNPTA